MTFEPRPRERNSPIRERRRDPAEGDEFWELARWHIDRAIEANQFKDTDLKQLYARAMPLIAEDAIQAITETIQSPIEQRLARRLVLSFLKAGRLGPLVYPTIKDTGMEVATYRQTLSNFPYFKSLLPEYELADGLRQLLSTRLAPDEWHRLQLVLSRCHPEPFDNIYHVTFQPPFPDIEVSGKSVRADFYFWVPRHPNINIVVECDGYEHHKEPERFTSDRQRDRIFKAHGYSVLRFSGFELYHYYQSAAHELATYLWGQADDADSAFTKSKDYHLGSRGNENG